MSEELAGKVAIVTGAANGIGKATAEMFVAEGAKVVIADVDDAAGGQVAASLGDAAIFVHTDVSEAESVTNLVEKAVEHFGKLDTVVNNAGISGSFRRLMMDDLRDFHKVIAVDLLGVMLGTQIAARKMAPGGSIINTTSIAGIQPGVGFSSYRAAKAGVIHFSRCAAIELAELGLRVNVIAPGNIATQINAIFNTESVVAQIQPLQRLGSPKDLANAAVYLASDRAAQVTGVVLPVDGGTTAGHPPLSTDSVMRKT
ncbi:MAG: SDR family oxidoreductase [Frankiaceae bacterium]|nr:SDR family oxidoreductase [Frankiaceae bacterium]MBV9870640.1 SDR family oxidoreductase [Frankiaceae bacterium]